MDMLQELGLTIINISEKSFATVTAQMNIDLPGMPKLYISNNLETFKMLANEIPIQQSDFYNRLTPILQGMTKLMRLMQGLQVYSDLLIQSVKLTADETIMNAGSQMGKLSIATVHIFNRSQSNWIIA